MALQKSDAHVSQQLRNLEVLSSQLVEASGASVDEAVTEPGDVATVVAGHGIRMGPFTLTADAMKEKICGMDLWVLEAVEALADSDLNAVMRVMAVLYLTALNGLMKVQAERNCYDQEFDSIPSYTPLDLISLSSVDFVRIVRKHKNRILLSFDECEITKIIEERSGLVTAVAREPTLKFSLESVAHKPFNQAWEPAGHRFQSLRRYAAGLASLMPTTSRVEADFSFINYRKNEYTSALSDFSLEGILFARQLKELEQLVNVLHS